MPIIVAGAGTSTAFTLTGRLRMNDGVTPVIGATVRVRPYTAAMPDPAANNVYVEDVILETDGNGEFATTLVGLEDVYYTVLSGDNRTDFRAGPFAAPLDGATIDLADIIALVPSPILPLDATALRAEFAAADNLKADKAKLALNLKDFGTLGAGNDSAVFQDFYDTTIGLGAIGFMPPGTFILGDPIIQSDLSELKYAFTGAGKGVTRLIVPASNTVGGLFLDATGTPRDAQVLLRDFSIITQGVGQGTGISFTMTPGGAQHQRSIALQNVEIQGEDPTEDCFDVGIDLTASWRPLLENVIVNGAWGSGIDDDQTDGSPLYVPTAALVLDDSYAWEINTSYFWGGTTSISDIGTNAEGGRLINSHMVGCLTGLDRFRSSPEPGLQVRGCHINYRNRGINIDGGKVSWITGCHIYNQDGGDEYSGNPVDIHLENVEEFDVHDNFFKYPGHSDRINVWVDGSTLARRVKIHDNTFASTGENAILVSTLATEVRVEDNDYSGGTYTKNVVDNSGDAIIRDSIGGVHRVVSQNVGASAGPTRSLMRDSASPAANDLIGRDSFFGKDSTDAETEYAAIQAQILTATNGSEAAALRMFAQLAGALTELAKLTPPATGETAMWGLVNRSGVYTLERFTYGATDSGGTGKRAVTIPN